MKKFILSIAALLTLCSCATLTADSDQEITVTTTPAGAACTLSSTEGTWAIEQTPGSATVARAFAPLTINCSIAGGKSGSTTIEAKTRGRAYGNILLLGVPAVVDASTGAGYEYDPSSVTLDLGAPAAATN